ncbi:MAG: pseudouridine synthase, partial [Parasporobacterium sp.]|nr:pseudouridine synthase [Parasporobacterium sp.]
VCLNEKFILIAFNKPVGVECTTSHEVENNIIDFIGFNERIFPIGRLDKNSSGLILLTNRGELNDKILRSANFHEKEYIVRTDKPFDAEFIKHMSEGVDITASFDRPLYKEGREDLRQIVTRPCTVKALSADTFSIILTQGLNRQIRRMCGTLGYNVVSLKRIRILNIELNDLKEGTYRDLTETEKNTLFNLIGATDER